MTDRTKSWAEDLRLLQTEKEIDSIIHVHPPTNKEVRLSPEVEQYLNESNEVWSFIVDY
jgi:phosphatidylinositol phospholipase C, delta